MKHLKLLLAGLCLLLTGCNTTNSDYIPVTGITAAETSILIETGEEHELDFIVRPNFATNTNVIFSEYAQAFDVVGNKVVGKSWGDGYLTVTTVDGGYSVRYLVTVLDNIEKEFPKEQVLNYYSSHSTVADIPEYACESQKAYYTYDNTIDDHFNIYVNLTKSTELYSYEEQLVDMGWQVLNRFEYGYTTRLQYIGSKATVDLYDWSSYSIDDHYILLSFWVNTKVSLDAMKIMSDIARAGNIYDEDIFVGPDENGIIRSTEDILLEAPYVASTLYESLMNFISKNKNENFPKYLFRLEYPYATPTGAMEVYLVVSNCAYVVHLTCFIDDTDIKINFEAGLEYSFPDAFVKIKERFG